MIVKRKYIGVLMLLSILMISSNMVNYRVVENKSFEEGEVIEYKVHYGFVNAATGKMVISDKRYNINGRECYKIDVFGESIGMFDLFIRIRDNWGTYLDTESIIPHRAYRKIEEGRYRKHEIVDFNHLDNQVKVKDYDFKKEEWKPLENFEVPINVQDMVSGYYYLRTFDFDKMNPGDIIKLEAFFDDEVYDFKIKFVGKEAVKTKIGKINAVVLSPIMPENSLFDGENSIRVWISDDINKVPLKVKAQMFIGAVEVDIESFDKGNIN